MDAGFLDELDKIRSEFETGPTGLIETAQILKRNPTDNLKGRQSYSDTVFATYPCRMQTVELTERVGGQVRVVGFQTVVDLPATAVITTERLMKVIHSDPAPSWSRTVRVVGFHNRPVNTLRRVIVVDTEVREST